MSRRKHPHLTESVMLTPMDLSEATRVGARTFRKQILPFTTITYRGRKIRFDRQFMQSVKDAFDNQAYDQVPLVLANAANEHHMDPERFTGDVQALELTDSGLDAIIKTTKRGARVINENPKVGVSVRIKSNLERADGRFFPRALNHVLVTMDPKVTGMTPWQTVDLSTDSTAEVVDLTAAHYKKGTTMAQRKAKAGQPQSSVVSIPLGDGKTQDLDLANLSDEEFQSLLDLATAESEDDDEDGGVVDVTGDLDDEDDEDDEDDDESDEDEDDEDDEEEPVTLSNPFARKGKKRVLESDADEEDKGGKPGLTKTKAGKVPPAFLKNTKAKKGAKKSSSRLVALSNQVAKNEWQRERRNYIKGGVPPHLLDLAEPVLSSADDVSLDLSNADESIDVAGILRDMLDATRGYIEQKPEVGHQIDLSEAPESEADALAKAWDAQYGEPSITI
jgi:hypothetical protein